MENVKQTEEKCCVACQGKLVLVCEDVYLRFDTPFQFFQDGLSMNVYECENCHRLDFYNSSPEPSVEDEKEMMITCPECGQEHSKFINCPHCITNKGYNVALKFSAEKEKKTSRKKNEVPWEF